MLLMIAGLVLDSLISNYYFCHASELLKSSNLQGISGKHNLLSTEHAGIKCHFESYRDA